MTELKYLAGWGNHHATEDPRAPGSLPKNQNTPRNCPYGLYAEQISGTAFTAPRGVNRRSWAYRILPSAKHEEWKPVNCNDLDSDWVGGHPDPGQKRWAPFEIPNETKINFVQGLHTISGAGDERSRSGIAIHIFVCNESMKDCAFQSSDGEMMIVAQEGTLHITTEFGKMDVSPGEICVIPQLTRFSVAVDGFTRGYICEVFGTWFQIPSLGPIGANGLANPRDFQAPVAWYEDTDGDFRIYNKYQGKMFVCVQDHSCFDVVAWHGNFYAYKYDLFKFNAVNSVTYDHLDPSIFTVLSAPSTNPGTAVCDFAIFPPRWSVHQNTFRPPYYHRNVMSEFMGLITGNYEAKAAGFKAGGATLHSIGSAHGPDADCFESASQHKQNPEFIGSGNMAFMFETCFMLGITKWGHSCGTMEKDYMSAWRPLKKHFDLNNKPNPADDDFYKRLGEQLILE